MRTTMPFSTTRRLALAVTAAVAIALAASADVRAQSASADADDWQFGLSIYGWFPSVSGETAVPVSGEGGEIGVDVEDIIGDLEFVLMGTLDVHKGRWGMVADLIYMDIGASANGTRNGTIGGSPIPADAAADLKLDLQSLVVNLAGTYRAVEKPGLVLDVLAGVRYLDVEQKLDYTVSGSAGRSRSGEQTGTGEVSADNWDALIGLRGRFAFGAEDTWFVPYYLDVGTGDSDLTSQGAAGLGYAFAWGDLVADWRYLYYDLSSDGAIADMLFNGPVAGATFRW